MYTNNKYKRDSLVNKPRYMDPYLSLGLIVYFSKKLALFFIELTPSNTLLIGRIVVRLMGSVYLIS